MPLETASFLPDLNSANPAHTDQLAQADSHLRLLKSTLKATFPNFTSAALASTQAQLDAIAALLIGGRLYANGAVPPGQIADFGGTTAPAGWLICDGSLISRTGVNADLFSYIGTTWGAGDGSTTFAIPNLQNRYRRHRQVGGPASIVGTLQASANQTHTHDVSGTTAFEGTFHTHGVVGSTAAMSANATHSHTYNDSSGASGGVTGGGGLSLPLANFSNSTSVVNTDHTHSLSITSAGQSGFHTHPFTATSATGTQDGAEARPVSATVLTCIKL